MISSSEWISSYLGQNGLHRNISLGYESRHNLEAFHAITCLNPQIPWWWTQWFLWRISCKILAPSYLLSTSLSNCCASKLQTVQGLPRHPHHYPYVTTDATDIKDEEVSIIIQKKLNIIGRPFKGTDSTHVRVHIFGLFIERARWNHGQKVLEDLPPHELCCSFPEIYFLPTKISTERANASGQTDSELYMFKCPIYQTPEQSRILTTLKLWNLSALTHKETS